MAELDQTVKGKILAVASVWIAFVALYFLLQSGNSTMIWVGLGLMFAANLFMAMKN